MYYLFYSDSALYAEANKDVTKLIDAAHSRIKHDASFHGTWEIEGPF